jgi:hypothetical protein
MGKIIEFLEIDYFLHLLDRFLLFLVQPMILRRPSLRFWTLVLL